jgi:thymidylate kinase
MLRNRPLIVEFAGMPQTGKDTTIGILAHYLKRKGLREYVCQEGARTCPIYKDDRLLYASWIIHRVTLEITEISTVHRGRYDVSILNRGIYDALAFFYLLNLKGIISDEHWLYTRNYFTLDTWTKLTDVIFLFKANAETSISRELENKLVKTDGVVMNLDTLKTLEVAYEHIQGILDKKCKIIVIDSQNKNIRECAQIVADHVSSLLATNKR